MQQPWVYEALTFRPDEQEWRTSENEYVGYQGSVRDEFRCIAAIKGMGLLGWEMCGVDASGTAPVFYFKRPASA